MVFGIMGHFKMFAQITFKQMQQCLKDFVGFVRNSKSTSLKKPTNLTRILNDIHSLILQRHL